MDAGALQAGLTALGIRAEGPIADKLYAYLALIAKWNQVYNLTAIREMDRMVVEHALDSLAILPHVRPARVLDVGSGAGLPGIPLAIAQPQWRVSLLDSNHKKCVFLRQAVIELDLANVEVMCQRVETVRSDLRFDTIVSRAFAETQHFAKVALPLLAPQGVMLAMKGLYPHEELAQLPKEVALQEVVPLDVPGLNARRHLVVMTIA
jgi:16S rRNA (guanine527-N7)-methyltransferase